MGGGKWLSLWSCGGWWCGLEELLCIGRLHGSSQTFFEGYYHLIDHLFRVEGWWSIGGGLGVVTVSVGGSG